MKVFIAIAALTLGLSSIAMAQKDSSKVYGEGQECDINGCRQSSGSEDFWNQWYEKQYGYKYDSGYYGPGEDTPRVPGYGPGYGEGGGSRNVTASTVYCWGKKARGGKYIVTVKATASKKAAAARKAVAACEQETGVRCVAVCQYRN